MTGAAEQDKPTESPPAAAPAAPSATPPGTPDDGAAAAARSAERTARLEKARAASAAKRAKDADAKRKREARRLAAAAPAGTAPATPVAPGAPAAPTAADVAIKSPEQLADLLASCGSSLGSLPLGGAYERVTARLNLATSDGKPTAHCTLAAALMFPFVKLNGFALTEETLAKVQFWLGVAMLAGPMVPAIAAELRAPPAKSSGDNVHQLQQKTEGAAA